MPQEKSKIIKTKRFQVSGKDREYLITNLSLLLKAAVPVGEALESLADTSSSRVLRAAISQIQHDIDEGYPLSQALERGGIAKGQTLALIKLGEQSGTLVNNLEIASKQEEKQRLFRSKVRSALLYPSFVLGMTVVVGLGVAWFLLPRLSETFAQLNVDLPFISKVLINFGIFLKTNGLWAIPAAFAMFALVAYILFGAPKTKHIGLSMLLHLPGISKLLHEIETARFGYLLGSLLKAGLPVTQSLMLLHDATDSPPYKKFYKYLHKNFEDGYSFKTSLAAADKAHKKLLPPAVRQMVIAAEQSGALSDTLTRVGDIYEDRADVSTKNLETVLEPILLIIVWLGVMLVAVAVIMPIYGLLGGLEPK